MVLPGVFTSDVTDQVVGVFKDPAILIGIPLALLGAIFMSFGAQFQHHGVVKVERLTGTSGSKGLTLRQFLNLARRPSWVFGTLMLGGAVVCQLAALTFAPLILVQPLGAISLVITTLLNARESGHKPTGKSIRAIVACVGGIFVFVTIAALFATDTPVSDRQLIIILALLLVVLATLVTVWLLVRKKAHPLFYIVASGVLYGFVATFAKTIITRIQSQDVNWLTILCAVGLAAAFAVGAYFVQTAYAVGPPDLVIAGLTVIDPLVAVIIGLTVLQEAASAPLGAFIGFGAAGLVAVYGVFSLARNHPQVVSDNRRARIEHGRDGGGPPAT